MRNRHNWYILLTIVLLSQLLAGTPALAGGPETTCPIGASGRCVTGNLSATEMRALNAEMALYPAPDVTQLPVNESRLYNRNYQRVMEATTIYDAPNGNPVGHLDPGFNFVSIMHQVDNWVQINYGQWIPADILGPARISRFTGVLLNSTPVYPFAWFMLDTRPSTYPGAEPIPGTPFIPRYTLTNIYAFAEVDGWLWYLVGPDQWIHQKRMAKITPIEPPDGVSGRWIALDLYEQTLIAYEDHTPIFATLISSGLEEWPTREGLFQIWDRHEQTKMSGAEGAPDFYYIQDVPWTMYFDFDIGLHGAYWHDGFGYRRSHGCVNLTITDSHWLYDWTADGYEDAYVYVYSSGEYR